MYYTNIRSLLGLSLDDAFLSYHKQNWLGRYLLEYKLLYYREYIDVLFVLSKPSHHVKRFQCYLSYCHVSMPFNIETEQNNKISFLNVNIIREQGKLITSVYRKLTFSGGNTHVDSFLLYSYNISIIYTLANICFCICFCICFNWSMFHSQLIFLRKKYSASLLSRKLH